VDTMARCYKDKDTMRHQLCVYVGRYVPGAQPYMVNAMRSAQAGHMLSRMNIHNSRAANGLTLQGPVMTAASWMRKQRPRARG